MTDGMSEARAPVFDKDGKYHYFTASTDSGASMQPDIHGFSRPWTHSIYLMVLSKDQVSPLAPESDDEESADEKKKDEAKKDSDKEEKDKSKPAEKVEVKIDIPNIGQRILALPMPPAAIPACRSERPASSMPWRFHPPLPKASPPSRSTGSTWANGSPKLL